MLYQFILDNDIDVFILSTYLRKRLLVGMDINDNDVCCIVTSILYLILHDAIHTANRIHVHTRHYIITRLARRIMR